MKLTSIRIFNKNQPDGASNSEVADGIRWAWDQKDADVINLSWWQEAPANVIAEAIEDARTAGRQGKGTVVVAAAGNTATRPGDVGYDLSVTITGSAEVQPNTICTYWASASGGDEPYSFYWYRNGFYLGTGSEMVVEASSSDYTLQVDALDRHGTKSGSETLNIAVNPDAMPCLQ